MSNDPIRDVHVYDGKWDKDIKLPKRNISINNKIELFKSLRDLIDEPTARAGLDLIINSIGQHSNYDNKNDVFADDILVELCLLLADTKRKEMLENKEEKKEGKETSADIINNISEQMKDMNLLGQCPQGRTTRLWQLYTSFNSL